MLTPVELQNLSSVELEEEIRKAKMELLKLRLSHANAQLKEFHKIKLYRRYVAQAKTLQNMMKKEAPKKSASPSAS